MAFRKMTTYVWKWWGYYMNRMHHTEGKSLNAQRQVDRGPSQRNSQAPSSDLPPLNIYIFLVLGLCWGNLHLRDSDGWLIRRRMGITDAMCFLPQLQIIGIDLASLGLQPARSIPIQLHYPALHHTEGHCCFTWWEFSSGTLLKQTWVLGKPWRHAKLQWNMFSLNILHIMYLVFLPWTRLGNMCWLRMLNLLNL